jgi:hypothetical protein
LLLGFDDLLAGDDRSSPAGREKERLLHPGCCWEYVDRAPTGSLSRAHPMVTGKCPDPKPPGRGSPRLCLHLSTSFLGRCSMRSAWATRTPALRGF